MCSETSQLTIGRWVVEAALRKRNGVTAIKELKRISVRIGRTVFFFSFFYRGYSNFLASERAKECCGVLTTFDYLHERGADDDAVDVWG
jgi:hypothetical protein